jgi:hypothetical protein
VNRFWENIIIIIDRCVYQYWICPKIFRSLDPFQIQSKMKIGSEICRWTDVTSLLCVHLVHFARRMHRESRGVSFCFAEQVGLVVPSIRKVLCSNLAQLSEAMPKYYKSPRQIPGYYFSQTTSFKSLPIYPVHHRTVRCCSLWYWKCSKITYKNVIWPFVSCILPQGHVSERD